MLVKTKAILLHHVRHSDNSLIAQFYTLDYGRLSVMVKGVSTKKGNARYLYFQPLYIFDIEIYYHDSRDLHILKELSLAFTPVEMPFDIHKSTIALFLSEVLYSVIREEDVNRKLFSFIETSVISLDEMKEGISNFHLWFLISLSAFTGIGPTPTSDEECFFDMMNGQFVMNPPLHPDYLEPSPAGILNRFLRSGSEQIGSIKMSGEERTVLLDQVIRYYNLHLPGMRRIRSLQVLNDVFR